MINLRRRQWLSIITALSLALGVVFLGNGYGATFTTGTVTKVVEVDSPVKTKAKSPLETDADSRVKTGEWSKPFSEGGPDFVPKTDEEAERYPSAVSMAVMPDGRVIYWNGLEGTEQVKISPYLNGDEWAENSRSRILDLRDGTPKWSIPAQEDGGGDDLFCAHQTWLHNGELLIAGGSRFHSNEVVDGIEITEVDGSDDSRIFSPLLDQYRLTEDMVYPRWYPTMLTMPNRQIFTVSGTERLAKNTNLTNVLEPEVFIPETETWRALGASAKRSLPLYPRIHLMPNGNVLYTASGQMWGPYGESADQAVWNIMATFDPRKNKWKDVGLPMYGARSGNTSVLLPLKPPYNEAKVLSAGGVLGTSPGTYVAHNLTEIITYNAKDDSIKSQAGPSLNQRRWFSSGVILADGKVALFNGADADHVVDPGSERTVKMAEMYDPQTNTWTNLSEAGRERTYHNTAVLLQDGSVLVGGHSPLPNHYGEHNNAMHDHANTAPQYKDPSFEIYKPPYFFMGPRPSIKNAPKEINYGKDFQIVTTDAKDISSVLLVRLPATSHVVDADQRGVYLDIVGRNGSKLTIKNTSSGAVLPPGYYFLFVNKETAKGTVPSEGKVVRITE